MKLTYLYYLRHFRSCCKIKTDYNTNETYYPENFYKYISVYSNNNTIECPLIFGIDDCIIGRNPVLKLMDFICLIDCYYKTLSKNLQIHFFDRYSYNDGLDSYNGSYSNVRRFVSSTGDKYIFTKGIIFDSNYNIMCLVTRVHYKLDEDNIYNTDNYYFKIYINPKCYTIKDNVCKWIINEFYKNVILYINTHTEIYKEHFEIEIKDPTDKFIIYPNETIDNYKLEEANNGDFIKQYVDIDKLSDYIINYNSN